MMTDREIQEIMDLAIRELKRKVTKEEAKHQLQEAGIYDKDGNFAPPYRNLEKVFIRKG